MIIQTESGEMLENIITRSRPTLKPETGNSKPKTKNQNDMGKSGNRKAESGIIEIENDDRKKKSVQQR